ncbi:MAG: hypothetical protein HC888_00935 [Candidatus Competibacteraceae bacterium]|nr:hypothetical protein [Candidatus Competibacteraceae bacterium]
MEFDNTSTTTPGLDDMAMSDDDAVAALTKRWTEEEDEDDTQSDTEETENEEEPFEESDEGTEEEGDEEGSSTREATDDDEVKVRVGDEEHSVKVKDLKRLFGQEAALTKKSQALAAERKAALEAAQVHAVALETLFQRSQSKLQKYSHMDWAMAAKELDPDTYRTLREEAQEAYNEHQYLVQEAQGFTAKQQEMQQHILREQAKVANEVLSDRIPEWGDRLYNEVRTYAIDLGMDANVVNNLTDPSAIQIIHKAMLYDQAQSTVNEKVKQAKAKTPKNVIKSKSRSAPGPKKQAWNKFQSTGSEDDAVAALLERWK